MEGALKRNRLAERGIPSEVHGKDLNESVGYVRSACPLLALVFISVSIFLHPWFTWADNALSDLGAIWTPYNMVFNVGMIFTGIIGLLFTVHLPKLTNGKIGIFGVGTFGLALIALIMIGCFPEGTTPHYFVSVTFFSLGALGVTILGIDQLIGREWAWSAFLLSIVASGLTSFLLLTTIPELGAAISEMIGMITFSEFSIVYGFRMLILNE